jgi:hypothetical protein
MTGAGAATVGGTHPGRAFHVGALSDLIPIASAGRGEDI